MSDELIKTDIPGYQYFSGIFASGWLKIILLELIFTIPFVLPSASSASKESILIGKDNLIIQIKGKKIELRKSEIKNIKTYWLATTISIEHNNPSLPKTLLFQSYWRLSFTLFKRTLYDLGYPGLKKYY